MADRLKAVQALQREFPQYFGNVDKETILNGNAKKSYDELSKSIVENARAVAAKSKIDEIEGQILASQFQQEKIRNAAAAETARAKAGPDIQGTTATDEFGNALQTALITRNDAIATIQKRANKALSDEDQKQASDNQQIQFLTAFAGAKLITKTIEDETTARGEKLKAINKKFNDDELQEESDRLKELSKAEDAGLDARVKARKKAADIEKQIAKDKAAIDLQNARDTLNAALAAEHEKDVDKSNSKDPSKAKGADQNAITNAQNQFEERRQEIAKESSKTLRKIASDEFDDILHIQFDSNAKRIANDKEANEAYKKSLADQKAAQLAAITNRSERELNGIKADSDAQAKIIIDRGNAELKAAGGNAEKIKEAEKRNQLELLQLDIDTSKLRIQVAINTAKALLAAANPTDQDGIEKLKAQIADLEKQAEELSGKQIKLDVDVKQEKIDEAVAGLKKLKDAYDTVTGLISKVVDAQTTAEKNRIQDQIDLLNKKTQVEIDGINASTDSAADKAAKIAVINARAAAQQAQLDLQTRQADERKAKYDKAVGIGEIIINTAIAVTKLLATPPLAIIAAALGAAELAIAIATPIPRYKSGIGIGNGTHPGGLAIVGDGGKSEYVQHPDGSGYVTPNKSTLIDLPKSSTVFPDAERLANARAYYSFPAVPVVPAGQKQPSFDNLERTMKKSLSRLESAITSKPTAVIKHTLNSWVTGREANQRHVEWVNRLFK